MIWFTLFRFVKICWDRQTIQFMLHINLLYMIVKKNNFLERYMQDCYTAKHIHNKSKEFNVKNKPATNKQKTFALVYIRYISFPEDSMTKNTQATNFSQVYLIIFATDLVSFTILILLERFMDTCTIFATKMSASWVPVDNISFVYFAMDSILTYHF